MSMKKYLAIVIIIALPAIFGCNQKNNETKIINPDTTDITDTVKKSIAAIENGKASDRKFIRTAEIKFKVQDVPQATANIDSLIKKNQGFIIYTNLSSDINNTTLTTISKDSSLETIYFTVSNNITVRIPNSKFDSTLKEIASLIDFLDYKIIKADDISFQVLSNNLTLKRASSGGKKQIAASEGSSAYKQEEADNAKVSNLYLNDQLKYSTINLIFSQRQSIKRNIIPNNKGIAEYTPGIGSKMVDSIKSGWGLVEALILFIIQLWAIILLAVAVYFFVRKFKAKHKK
ncbi:hypothetical protein GALL_108570 [mine drainage metagenome]|uniref:DUF4349 domain-containing protein n=1 Tax=mine drainage metagenome TaxID=410659 RepID=A0A1J5SEX4_9ZZZZ